MRPHPLLVFAQQAEARATLELFKAQPVAGEWISVWSEGCVPALYEFEHTGGRGWIAISNMGLHAAQLAVSKYAHLATEIWNLGFAGLVTGSVETQQLGTLVSIKKVGKYLPIERAALDSGTEECLAATLPTFSAEKASVDPKNLISSDFPIHDLERRRQLAHEWDLVDMEGYGIAFAATHLGKKWRLWKIVSDFACPGGRQLIQQNKARLSSLLAHAVEATLKTDQTLMPCEQKGNSKSDVHKTR